MSVAWMIFTHSSALRERIEIFTIFDVAADGAPTRHLASLRSTDRGGLAVGEDEGLVRLVPR